MSTRESIARHRADVPKTSSLAVIAKSVGANASGVGRQAAVIAAASGLVLSGGVAVANAAPAEGISSADTATNTRTFAQIDVSGLTPVTAASTVSVTFAAPAVASKPAPVKPKVVVQEAVKVVKQSRTAAPVAAAPAAATPAATAPAAVATPAVVAPAVAAPAAPVAQSGIGSIIAAAALAQIGRGQDCTALVSNSLAAAGIYSHGWPASYLGLGRTVSAAEAQPGDLLYYANGGMGLAHIAVYIGNGKAVHGGWGGGSTVVFSAYVGSGPVFIAMGH